MAKSGEKLNREEEEILRRFYIALDGIERQLPMLVEMDEKNAAVLVTQFRRMATRLETMLEQKALERMAAETPLPLEYDPPMSYQFATPEERERAKKRGY